MEFESAVVLIIPLPENSPYGAFTISGSQSFGTEHILVTAYLGDITGIKDYDRDGVSDQDEYFAGTNPLEDRPIEEENQIKIGTLRLTFRDIR